MSSPVRLFSLGAMWVALVLSAGSVTHAGSQCQTTLAYLDKKLPRYSSSDIRTLRSTILALNVNDSLERMKAKGIKPSEAAKALLGDAKQSVDKKRDAEECIRQFAVSDAAGAKIIGDLRGGTDTSLCRDGDTSSIGACICQWILLDFNQKMLEELAVQIGCLAK